MFLSLLYIVLIALIVVELAIVAWTVNFVRKYAFRPNPEFVDEPEAPEWPESVPEWQRVAFARPARNASTSPRREDGTFRQAERFGRPREANRRH
jgi:hypothetical protein